MNIITIELCQEDRNRLDTLIAIGLELADMADKRPPAAPQKPAEATQAPPPETTHPEPESTAQGTQEATAAGKLGDAGNEKLLSAVQQKVVKLSAAGKKAAVREIVQRYAAKVSDLPAGEYDTIMDALTALEG